MPKSISFFLCLIIFIFSINPALAKWGTVSVTDDKGDQIVVKHGLFGKKTIVKDRYGDGFKHSRSIFGLTKDTQVDALGNDVHAHKGLFGFGKTEGHDILGDTISSNKNPLYRNTNVNLSGANSFLNKIFSKTSAPQLNPVTPGQSSSFLNNPASIPPPVVDPNKSFSTKVPNIQGDSQN